MSDDDRSDREGSSSREDSSTREDPFDRLGTDAERDGDPFERLDGASPDGDSGGQHDPVDDDPWVPPGEDRRDAAPDDVWNDPGPANESSGGANASPAAGDVADAPDPFEHVDTPTRSPFEDAGSVFERVESGGADPDQVWESITGEDDGDDEAEPSVPDEGRYRDVSKHRFCEQCEHFSPPPDVSCGHHTAEIIEFLDMETVRLLDCPIVAEREELERRE